MARDGRREGLRNANEGGEGQTGGAGWSGGGKEARVPSRPSHHHPPPTPTGRGAVRAGPGHECQIRVVSRSAPSRVPGRRQARDSSPARTPRGRLVPRHGGGRVSHGDPPCRREPARGSAAAIPASSRLCVYITSYLCYDIYVQCVCFMHILACGVCVMCNLCVLCIYRYAWYA